MGCRRCVSRVLLGRPDEKRQLGRTKRRWKDNIKMDIQEIGWGSTEGRMVCSRLL